MKVNSTAGFNRPQINIKYRYSNNFLNFNLKEGLAKDTINFNSNAQDYLLSIFQNKTVDLYCDKFATLQINDKNEIIKAFKLFCMKNIELIERKNGGRIEQNESDKIIKSCYETFLFLLKNDLLNKDCNLKDKVFNTIHTFKTKHGVYNPVEYLQYSKTRNGEIDFDLARAMMKFCLNKNDRSVDLTLPQKEELVLRYCSEADKIGNKSIDVIRAGILSHLFFDVAQVNTIEETDKLFSLVYDCKNNCVDNKKELFASYSIKQLKLLQRKSLPLFFPFQNEEYFNKMIFDITGTLIDNNSDKIKESDYHQAQSIFDDFLKYVQNNRYQLDNQIYVDKEKNILINDLSENSLDSYFYANDIFRMHSILKGTNFKNYTVS